MQKKRWRHEKEITIDAEYEFNSFKLDKDVCKNVQFNLSDIRIVDESDCYIPFYISKDKTEEQNYEESIQFDRIGKYRYKKHMFYEFRNDKELLKDSAMADELILGVNSSRDYFQYIDVYGSLDSEHWQFIQTDSIYRIEDSENLKISFDQTKKYVYYRLVIREQQSDVDITYIYQSLIDEKNVNREIELHPNQSYEVLIIRIHNGSDSPLNVKKIEAVYWVNRRKWCLMTTKESVTIQMRRREKSLSFHRKCFSMV